MANTTSTTIRLIVTPTPLAVTSTRSHHPSNQKHQLATRKKAKGKARKAKAKEVTASTSDQPSRKTTTIATSWCFNSCCNNSSYTGFLTFASRLMHNITPKLRDLVGGNTHNMNSFFHKRCDCLKEYHREFKATVSKMSWCAICEVLKDHHFLKLAFVGACTVRKHARLPIGRNIKGLASQWFILLNTQQQTLQSDQIAALIQTANGNDVKCTTSVRKQDSLQ